MVASISAMAAKNSAVASVQAIHSSIAHPPHTRPRAKPLAM